ncbi:MAG TPA: hypothetical protein VMR14_03560 [Streptosporangiaceae bacterium]|nr:hypothetical protein [Streptosporangiaceae bacterium]
MLVGSLSYLALGAMNPRFRQRAARFTAASALAFSIGALLFVMVYEVDGAGISESAKDWLFVPVFALLAISIVLGWKAQQTIRARYGADAPDSLHGKHEIKTGHQ